MTLWGFFIYAWNPSYAYDGLASTTPASLMEHLIEVNQEWKTQNIPLQNVTTEVFFSNETARIQTHLKLVTQILRSRPVSHLTTAQQNHRAQLLDHLQQYYETGQFPVNNGHKIRIPYFIDDWDTPCAVGYLLIQSDHEELAQQIRQEMNQAYVREIPYPALTNWANTYGFTAEELAWIQPGYPPSIPWAPVGGGTDGPITALFTPDGEDVLYLAGDFGQVGEKNAQGIAMWDGETYTALGEGLVGMTHVLTMYKDTLYAGGLYMVENETYNIAMWEGNSWKYERILIGGSTQALQVVDGTLYAGGDFDDGTDLPGGYVFERTDMGWQQVGMRFNGVVKALTDWGGILVVGGEFTEHEGKSLRHIGQWDSGQWEAIGNGVPNTVLSLAIHQEQLHASGEFYPSDSSTFMGVERYNAAQKQWEELLDSTEYFVFTIDNHYEQYISTLKSYGERLYVGGYFGADVWNAMVFGTNMGYVADTIILPEALTDDPVHDLAFIGQEIYMGGAFDTLAKQFSAPITGNYLVQTTLPGVGVDDDIFSASYIIPYPNPMTSQTRIPLGKGNWKNPQLNVFNTLGQPVSVRYEPQTDEIILERGNLAPGHYFFQITHDNKYMGKGKLWVAPE